jgi:hypothetical protein
MKNVWRPDKEDIAWDIAWDIDEELKTKLSKLFERIRCVIIKIKVKLKSMYVN